MDGSSGRFQPPAGSTQRQRDQFYQDLKRNDRAERGRCRYCGKLPAAGRKSCERCLEIARRNAAPRRERMRAMKEAERRAALPRQCPACASYNLGKAGQLKGRQRYVCRDCGRHSYGDGPPAPRPSYPCPYCGAQCIKRGRSRRVKRQPLVYTCTVCGRWNTNLWPEDTPSPGGPFPHRKRFLLSYLAIESLMRYCQERKMSEAQAIRDIFIRAGKTPRVPASGGCRVFGVNSIHSRIRLSPAPAPVLPAIPPGGVRFPSAFPEASKKLVAMRTGRGFNPTVLVAQVFSVCLNDAALAGLLETMRRRGLNHQDAARALITEAGRKAPIIAVAYRSDLDDGW